MLDQFATVSLGTPTKPDPEAKTLALSSTSDKLMTVDLKSDEKSATEMELDARARLWAEEYYAPALEAIEQRNWEWLEIVLGPETQWHRFTNSQALFHKKLHFVRARDELNLWTFVSEQPTQWEEKADDDELARSRGKVILSPGLAVQRVANLEPDLVEQEASALKALNEQFAEDIGRIEQSLESEQQLVPATEHPTSFSAMLDRQHQAFLKKVRDGIKNNGSLKEFKSTGNLPALKEALQTKVTKLKAKVNKIKEELLLVEQQCTETDPLINAYRDKAVTWIAKNQPTVVFGQSQESASPTQRKPKATAYVQQLMKHEVEQRRVKDAEGNTLLHHTLRAYAHPLGTTESERDKDRKKILHMIRILIHQQASFKAMNADSQTPHQYAGLERFNPISLPTLANFNLHDWELIRIEIEAMPVWSQVEHETKKQLLEYIKVTYGRIAGWTSGFWKVYFSFRDYVDRDIRLQDVNALKDALRQASEEGNDGALSSEIRERSQSTERGGDTESKLFKGLYKEVIDPMSRDQLMAFSVDAMTQEKTRQVVLSSQENARKKREFEELAATEKRLRENAAQNLEKERVESAGKDTVIAEQKGELTQKKTELTQKHQEAAQQANLIGEKDRVIANKTMELTKERELRDKVIETHEQTLQQHAKEFAALQQQMQEVMLLLKKTQEEKTSQVQKSNPPSNTRSSTLRFWPF